MKTENPIRQWLLNNARRVRVVEEIENKGTERQRYVSVEIFNIGHKTIVHVQIARKDGGLDYQETLVNLVDSIQIEDYIRALEAIKTPSPPVGDFMTMGDRMTLGDGVKQ